MTADPTDPLFKHLNFLDDVCNADIAVLKVKDREYGASWKADGGVSTFHMLKRKWDRLMVALKETSPEGWVNYKNLFQAIMEDARSEGIIDDIRDLRRYLTLVEAELLSRGYKPAEVVNTASTNATQGGPQDGITELVLPTVRGESN